MNRETGNQKEQRMDREFVARRTGQTRGGSWQGNAYLYAKGKRRQTIAPGIVVVWAK